MGSEMCIRDSPRNDATSNWNPTKSRNGNHPRSDYDLHLCTNGGQLRFHLKLRGLFVPKDMRGKALAQVDDAL